VFLAYNNLTRSRNIYSSFAVLRTWCHFTRRERFCWDL